MPDILVIGGGHNALVAAFYLAKAGRKPLVLERRSVIGGCAVTEEFAPGYKAPTLAHTFGPMRDSIVRDMHLERRGVQFVRPDPRLTSLGADGRSLVFSTDVQRTSQAIRELSPADAEKYPQFCATMDRLGGFLGGLLEMTPPSIDAPSGAELWALLKTGRRFRALGKKDSFSLLRWGPMAVADLVAEWFETDLLQGSVASRGIFGTFMGPWSAGSGAVLLLNAASDPAPGGSSVSAIGGPGSVTAAMAQAAIEAGAEIRTGADVERVLIKDGSVRGRRPRRRHRALRRSGGLGRRSATDVSGADRSNGSRSRIPHAHPELPRAGNGRQDQRRPERAAGVSQPQGHAPPLLFADA